MTVFNILGFFKLASGRVDTTTKPKSNYTVSHILYSTKVWCADGTTIVASLRLYSDRNTAILPDGTIVFALCKAQSSPNADILLDAITFIPMPGVPGSQAYEDHLPETKTSMVFAIGNVTAAAEILDDGYSSRTFAFSVSEYVRDSMKTSPLQCVYDFSTPRWKQTPVPAINSCIQAYGLCRGRNASGTLRINVDSISLNVGSNANAVSSTATPATPASTPNKRRKFGTPSPPSSPSPHASTSIAPVTPGSTAPASAPSDPPSLPMPTSPMQLPPGTFPPGPYNQFAHFQPFAGGHPFYGQGMLPMGAGQPYPFYTGGPVFGGPDPYTDTANQSVQAPARDQQNAAFFASAANPYAYPMTQSPTKASGQPMPPAPAITPAPVAPTAPVTHNASNSSNAQAGPSSAVNERPKRSTAANSGGKKPSSTA